MRIKEDAAMFGSVKPKQHRKLICKTCDKQTPHTLKVCKNKSRKRDHEYYCDKCGSEKFIGFPEYVCHSRTQKECISENGFHNSIWCLDCIEYY